VRGIPSPFIKIYERGRDTPHPSLHPLLPRIDFLDGVLANDSTHEEIGKLRTYNCVAFVQYLIVQRVFECVHAGVDGHGTVLQEARYGVLVT
jgi:hypothetical protein